MAVGLTGCGLVDQQLGGHPAQQVPRLGHRRQWDGRSGRVLDVVVADDRHVVRDPDPGLGEVLEQTEEKLSFDVTRCRYAEMYRALGIPEVGALLSCNRDFSLVEGFNPDVKLTRTQTVMEGASHCDFRFVLRKPRDPKA